MDDGLPPVLSFPSRTLLRLLDREISIKGDSQIVFLVWKAESDDSAELGKRFDALAKAHRGRSLFIGIDAEDSAAMKYFKIPRTELPAARAINYVGTEMRLICSDVEVIVVMISRPSDAVAPLTRSGSSSYAC